MAPFRFLHAADLHLDTPFHGVGRRQSEWQKILRDASLRAFDTLVSEAVSREVDFVLLAGDIYDGSRRGVRAQARFVSGLRRLDGAGIPTFFIHGNHDPVEEGWSALKREDFPPSVTLFDKSDSVEARPVEKDGKTIAVVHGISFRTSREERNLVALFPAEPDPRFFHIGLVHANVGGDPEHGNYAPCSLEDLRRGGMDYWALGHIHKRAVLLEGGPTAVYPGNIQARSFKETGAKGATLVEVDSAGRVAVEHLALDVVRFARLTVSVAGSETLEQICVRCEEEVEAAVTEAGGRRLLIRLHVVGTTPAHRDLALALENGEFRDALHDRLDLDRVWLTNIALKTSAPVDRERIREGAGFLSELLAASEEILADPAEAAAVMNQLQQPLRTGTRFREHLAKVSEEEAVEILQRAESRLLALLEDSDS